MGLRTNSNIVYSLKRQFGQRLTVVHRSNTTVNPQTGVVGYNTTQTIVLRAVVLPKVTSRERFFLNLFKQKGTFETDTREVIIDTKDITSPINIRTDRVIFNSEEYIIKKMEKSEDIGGYLLTVKNTDTMETL